jgi:cytochrome c oxidase subunit 3/cytochrome c oxidase subunit I+III
MEYVETGKPGEVLPHVASGARSISWWGMGLLIATEATLFALLIASYWYLRFRSGPVWPPNGIEKPPLGLPLIMSVILWSSSIPAHIADKGIQKGSQLRLRLGLLVSFLLGLTFLLLQIFKEYPDALTKHPPSSGAYGTMYFSLTGLHGLHVLVGLLISVWIQVRAWQGAFDENRHVSVQNFAMYWHFVDSVWVFVLATVFLSPHFI